jgi:uncharacterized protein YjbI with pentapeptide repeats
MPIATRHRAGAGLRRWIARLALPALLLVGIWFPAAAAEAITAPELRSFSALQDLDPDMHGRDLRQQEFLKAAMQGFDLHGADLRGAVFNSSDLRGADLHEADLRDVVAYATRFEAADLRAALLTDAMLLQSRFEGAEIENADFSDAVIDRAERRRLCATARGRHPLTGVDTRESLGCR